MLKYIYQSLMFFRKAFSGSFTWVMFCTANLIRLVPAVTNRGTIIIDVQHTCIRILWYCACIHAYPPKL